MPDEKKYKFVGAPKFYNVPDPKCFTSSEEGFVKLGQDWCVCADGELEEIAARLEGEEASDYVVAAELYERQTALEESLLALYEENEGFAE